MRARPRGTYVGTRNAGALMWPRSRATLNTFTLRARSSSSALSTSFRNLSRCCAAAAGAAAAFSGVDLYGALHTRNTEREREREKREEGGRESKSRTRNCMGMVRARVTVREIREFVGPVVTFFGSRVQRGKWVAWFSAVESL